jgi:hypothetical protein
MPGIHGTQDLRDPRADNQLFYIDETGALCSKYSGHAIDVEGDALSLSTGPSDLRPYLTNRWQTSTET